MSSKLWRVLKKQFPHSVSDLVSTAYPVPERHPPSFVLDKIGSTRKSFAVRSINITNKRGIEYVDIDVPKYKAMHGSEYLKKHQERLKRQWGH